MIKSKIASFLSKWLPLKLCPLIKQPFPVPKNKLKICKSINNMKKTSDLCLHELIEIGNEKNLGIKLQTFLTDHYNKQFK